MGFIHDRCFASFKCLYICDQKCDKSPVKTDEHDHPDLTASNFMGNSIRHRLLLMLDIAVSDITEYSDHSPITAYFALKHIDLFKTNRPVPNTKWSPIISQTYIEPL